MNSVKLQDARLIYINLLLFYELIMNYQKAKRKKNKKPKTVTFKIELKKKKKKTKEKT